MSDTNRILLAGAWETTGTADQTEPKQNRVWYTPVLGSTDEGDDERIPNTVDQQNWVDVGNEGPITGLGGPLRCLPGERMDSAATLPRRR